MDLDRFGPLIQLADLDGSNVVEFRNDTAPYPIPRPKSAYQVQLSIMRPGITDDGLVAGLRVAQIIGTHRSHRDIGLKCAYLAPDQVDAIQTKHERLPPQAMKLTLDGGTTWDRCVFQQDGWDARHWEQNWRDQGGDILLHLLGQIVEEEE